jgi:BlaI family transcriptional regulator, penicillinase repressor
MLTPLELDIMKVVWQQSPITVKDVQTAIRPRRTLAYTTVMTIMHRMHQKGLLSRKLRSRTHYYEPAVPYTEVRDAELDRLIDNFFAGSRESLVDFLEDLSPHERGWREAPGEGQPKLDETLL